MKEIKIELNTPIASILGIGDLNTRRTFVYKQDMADKINVARFAL